MQLMPKTIPATDIQRHYRLIFDQAKNSNSPIIVLTNNKPDVAIVGMDYLEDLYAKAQIGEIKQALQAIKVYQGEKQNHQLKKLTSLKDLL